MKYSHLIGGVFGLLAGCGLLGSSSVLAATPKATAPFLRVGTYNIVYDGYCDGLQITLPGSAGAPGVQAIETGCNSEPLYGVAGPAGLALADATYASLMVIRTNHTWVYYGDAGGGVEFVKSFGTWSFGTPTPNSTAPSLHAGGLFGGTGAVGPARMPGPRAAVTRNVYFPGYCDGLHIDIPGGAGAPGIDGTQNGCDSDPLIGAKDQLNLAALWDYTTNVMWVLFPDQTFIIYTDCGDGTECFVNSGNWKFGTPPAPQGRTLVPSSLRR